MLDECSVRAALLIRLARENSDAEKDKTAAEQWFEREEDFDKWMAETGQSEPPWEFFDVECFAGDWEKNAQAVSAGSTGKARSEYFLEKFETEAAKNWDVFYKRNTNKFFKDRHYLLKDFVNLAERIEVGDPCSVLEVGSGVGNTIIPLTNEFKHLSGFGIDFAETAIDILNGSAGPSCKGFVCDISKSQVPAQVPAVDFATMIFVLSAIAPENMEKTVSHVVERLKPGGYLLFRDYGELDQAQLRFSEDQRLGLNYYVRQDGTRSFFFTLDGMSWLFEHCCGLERVEARSIRRVVMNRGANMRMRRVFVNATYRKCLG